MFRWLRRNFRGESCEHPDMVSATTEELVPIAPGHKRTAIVAVSWCPGCGHTSKQEV